MTRRALRGATSNYIGRFLTLSATLLLTPFILGQVGVTGYGLWVLVNSVIAYGFLLDFGIAGAVVKYVAEYVARGERDNARRFVATALWLYTALGLIAFAATAVFAPVFPTVFNVPPDQRETATGLILGMGVVLGVQIPSITATAVLQGLHRYDLVNLIGVLSNLLVAAASVIVLLAGGGVIGLVLINIVVALLTPVLSVSLVRSVAPDLSIGWSGASRQLLGPMLSFSVTMFFGQSAGQLKSRTDEMVIATFLPVSSVAPYAIARKLSALTLILARQFSRVLLPLASELDAQRDLTHTRSLYLDSSRLMLAISVPMATTLVLLAGPILNAWVGPAFVEYAYLMVLLTVASLLDVSQWPAVAILQGSGRYRVPALVSVSSAVANLGLSIALIHPLGLAGVALGTLIPTTVENIVFLLPYALRTIGVSASNAFKDVLWPVLLPLAPMLLVVQALRQMDSLSSVASVVGATLVGLLVFAAVYVAVGARKEERQMFLGGALNALRRAESRLKRS